MQLICLYPVEQQNMQIDANMQVTSTQIKIQKTENRKPYNQMKKGGNQATLTKRKGSPFHNSGTERIIRSQ